MTKISLLNAIIEAERFIRKAQEAKEAIERNNLAIHLGFGCKETAACRRASLDLTRALAQMRKRI